MLLNVRIKPGRATFVTGDLARRPASYPQGADIKAAYMTRAGASACYQTQSYALYRGAKTEAKRPKDKTTGVYFPVSIWNLPVSTPAARSYAVPSNEFHAANFEFEVMGRANAKVEVEGTK